MIVTWQGQQGSRTLSRSVVFTRRAVPLPKTVTPQPATTLVLTTSAPQLGLDIIRAVPVLTLVLTTYALLAFTPPIYPNASWEPVIYLQAQP